MTMSDRQTPTPADDDLVSTTFEHMRSIAAQRDRNLPPLPKRAQRQGFGEAVPEISENIISAKNAPTPARRWPRKGRPTGIDGRPLYVPRPIPTMGTVVKSLIRERSWEQQLSRGWVISRWESFVGEAIASHTTVEMVKDSVVFISTDSTAWATNLRLMQSDILSKIAEAIGPGIITEVKIFPPKAPSWRKGPLHVKGRGPRDTYG